MPQLNPINQDLHGLVEQVAWNCQVASAGQAGHLKLCDLLLRLRQLFKWEHHLPPWEEPEPDAVLAWVELREQAWEALGEAGYRPLGWGGGEVDPFAVDCLNDQLMSAGLAYGAGLTRGLNPTFFLGELAEVRREDELTILILGPELARDLEAAPALRQGPLIYARTQALGFFLWDRLSDPTGQNNCFLKMAMSGYDLPQAELLRQPAAFQSRFQAMCAGELEAVIRHEIGEAREPSLAAAFPAILEKFPQTRLELWLRGLKDALADVNDWGRLAFCIKERRLASVAAMLAWRPGLYSLLLPEVEPACRLAAQHQDWQPLEEARHAACARLRGVAADLEELLRAMQDAPDAQLRQVLEERYLAPLGL